jgi:2-polyprenyl-3-methyl-5-hydroxy-6-metoxy-1,4-benzoquinol methylase
VYPVRGMPSGRFSLICSLIWRPEVRVQPVRDVPAEPGGDVRIPSDHRGVRPVHEVHHGSLRDTEKQQGGGRCVARVVQPLDAGCGEGYLSRILARNGATVTGVDSSAKLIEAARTQNDNGALTVSFDVASVDEMPYTDDTFDLVVCNHVLNDLHDPSKAISEFARVLHNGGRLIILMLHPCFYNKHAEREQATNGLIAASYFETRNIEQAFEVDGLTSPVANTAWFRPLEFYTEELRKSGVVLTSLTEPHPSPEQVQADSWWRKGFTRPLFMFLVAQLWDKPAGGESR